MKSATQQIRLSPEEKTLWQSCAKMEDLDLSEWIRQRCNEAVLKRPSAAEFLERKKKEYENSLKVALPVKLEVKEKTREELAAEYAQYLPKNLVAGKDIPLSDLDDDEEVKQIAKKDAVGMLWARRDE